MISFILGNIKAFIKLNHMYRSGLKTTLDSMFCQSWKNDLWLVIIEFVHNVSMSGKEGGGDKRFNNVDYTLLPETDDYADSQVNE